MVSYAHQNLGGAMVAAYLLTDDAKWPMDTADTVYSSMQGGFQDSTHLPVGTMTYSEPALPPRGDHRRLGDVS